MGFKRAFSQFGKIEKVKTQRDCKGCTKRIIVENRNRYYCNDCRRQPPKKNGNDA